MINPTKKPNMNPQKKSLSVPTDGSGLMYGRKGELVLGSNMGFEPSELNIKSSSSSSESLVFVPLRRDKRPRLFLPEPDRKFERLGLLGLCPEMAASSKGLLVLRFILNSE